MLQADAIITLDAGRYRLRDALAGSAYGLVWRAEPVAGGGAVALKFINAAQMACAAPLQRARWVDSAANEIAFLRSLAPWDERHIVRLLDSGSHDGLPVLALELLGVDLGRHLAAARALGQPPAMAAILAWVGQINQALAKVHQYGWRYLDLKPANLLLHRATGGVKLADFGTSCLLAAAPTQAYAGTASWQAPEQFFPSAQGSYDTDIRTDYFALGAMLYYLVTGGLPLRFCSDCGNAYREHQSGGAALLLARHGGRAPSTLHDDEAALFAQRAGHGLDDPAPALALLRVLLAARREERPRNALQISRMLQACRPAAALRASCARVATPAWSPA